MIFLLRSNPAGFTEMTSGVYLTVKPEPRSQVTTLLWDEAGTLACCISPDVAVCEMAQQKTLLHGLTPEEGVCAQRNSCEP